MAAMFALSCFLEHLFRLVKHHLSFRDTMFWSSTGILLIDKATDLSKIAISLLGCCRTPLVLQISPAQLQQMIPISEKALQSGH